MRHHKAVTWEKRLKAVFDKIDDHLEAKYGKEYPLRPTRAKRGTTSNKEHDGLFRIGAAFTAGYGSKVGRGYAVEILMVTLKRVPKDIRQAIEEEVATMLRQALPEAFPGRKLNVSRDGRIYKIHGDLKLGRA